MYVCLSLVTEDVIFFSLSLPVVKVFSKRSLYFFLNVYSFLKIFSIPRSIVVRCSWGAHFYVDMELWSTSLEEELSKEKREIERERRDRTK